MRSFAILLLLGTAAEWARPQAGAKKEQARTKLTNAYFDSKLATTSTARNWRRVLKLFELMKSE